MRLISWRKEKNKKKKVSVSHLLSSPSIVVLSAGTRAMAQQTQQTGRPKAWDDDENEERQNKKTTNKDDFAPWCSLFLLSPSPFLVLLPPSLSLVCRLFFSSILSLFFYSRSPSFSFSEAFVGYRATCLPATLCALRSQAIVPLLLSPCSLPLDSL